MNQRKEIFNEIIMIMKLLYLKINYYKKEKLKGIFIMIYYNDKKY